MIISVELCREFIVLAEQLSFTSAAKRLQTTQPQLSKHIAALEKALGARLVERGGPKLALTPAGAEFLEGSIAIVTAYESTLRRVHHAAAHPVRSLVVVGPFMFGVVRDRVTAAITRARNEQPLDVSFVAEPPLPYVEMVRAGEADLAVDVFSENLVTDELEWLVLSRDQIYIAVRDARFTSEHGSSIPLAALEGATIHSVDGLVHTRGRERFLELCASQGVRVHPHILRADPFDLRLDEVGDEVVVLSQGVKDHYPLTGMTVYGIEDPDCYFELAAFWRSDSPNPGVPLLVRHLAENATTCRSRRNTREGQSTHGTLTARKPG